MKVESNEQVNRNHTLLTNVNDMKLMINQAFQWQHMQIVLINI